MALGGRKKHRLYFYFSREKTFSREKVEYKKKGYRDMQIVAVGAIMVAVYGIGYIVGAKVTDKKHGVNKHFWEY